MKSGSILVCITLAVAGLASAQTPTIDAGGVVNAASYAYAGLPSGGIAQGSLFAIFGKNLGPTPFVAGRWQYAVATLDLATRAVAVYVDTQPMGYTVVNVPTLWTTAGNPGDWLWGSNSGTSGSFGGMMDEIRVLSGVQTPGWIATTFANQHDPGAFVSVGAAETVTP